MVSLGSAQSARTRRRGKSRECFLWVRGKPFGSPLEIPFCLLVFLPCLRRCVRLDPYTFGPFATESPPSFANESFSLFFFCFSKCVTIFYFMDWGGLCHLANRHVVGFVIFLERVYPTKATKPSLVGRHGRYARYDMVNACRCWNVQSGILCLLKYV